MKTAQIQTRWH